MQKKKIQSLLNKNLEFTQGGITYKLISFHPKKMTLETIRFEHGEKIDTFTLPFAHLPKNLKKIVKIN